MKSLGIIGYGHFGKFLAEKLHTQFDLKVYSHSGKDNQWKSTLQEVCETDYLILSLPLSKHADICDQIEPHIKPGTVIVDVCSIKGESSSIIKKHLPKQRLISTHPLFGPESAANSLDNHVIVLCPDKSDINQLELCGKFCNKIGLKVIMMDSEDHDRELALVQGLTFFIARILKDFKLDSTKLVTPSFKKLIDLANLEKHHTKDLFITIEKGNKYSEEIRQHFINRAQELQNLLAKERIK